MDEFESELPGLTTDSDTDDNWESDQSMPGLSSESSDDENFFHLDDMHGSSDNDDAAFISSGAMTTQSTESTGQIDIHTTTSNPLPGLVSESESENCHLFTDEWNTVEEYSTESSDTSDDDFFFNDNLSEPSDDSSVADDEEFGVFEMLSHHIEMFSNAAPTIFGVSLQMLYDRLMDSLELEEEKDTPTPQEIIDTLQVVTVTIAQVASNLSCPICFCEYVLEEDLLHLPCSHYYHKNCILNWLKIKSTCPTCRLDLTSENVDTESINNPELSSSLNNRSEQIHLNTVQGAFNTNIINGTTNSASNDQSSSMHQQTTNLLNTRTCSNTEMNTSPQNIPRDTHLSEPLQAPTMNQSDAVKFVDDLQTVPGGAEQKPTLTSTKDNKRVSRETEIW